MDMGIKLKVADSAIRLKVPVTVVHESTDGEIYQGDYTVTPKVTEEVLLQTKSKVMKNNVTVLKVPQFEVSNDAGGKTLILGDDYYG
jgi:cell division protein YceG involved in septum cleavage